MSPATTKRPPLSGQITDFDIRLLRVFKSVVECGGFSAAEVELNISRSAISIHMADLEKRLNLKLCQRGRSGFALTEEGRRVYEATLQTLSALEDFRTEVNAIHSRLRGELNIGITDNLVTMPHMRITHALNQLKEQGPDVRIHIRMMPPNDIERAVLDGRLHIGVVPDLRPLPGLDYLPLYQEESLLYCSGDHPLFASDADATAITQADAVAPAYAQTPEIRALHQPLKATATATDREGVAFLILTGRYIGFLPTHYAERWVEKRKMRALLPERYRYITEFKAITRKGQRPNLVLETYLEELEKTARETG